jgi:hypothetical protein
MGNIKMVDQHRAFTRKYELGPMKPKATVYKVF